MTTNFAPGTKVHVEFDAIVEEPTSWDFIKKGGGGLHATDGYGFVKVRDTTNSLYHYVWPGSYFGDDDDGNALVTIVKGIDWENYDGAQVGDIWEANNREFFAYKSFGDITLFPVDGGVGYFSSERLDEFAALNPRLVRRRGEDI
jgi:hypothetical protein